MKAVHWIFSACLFISSCDVILTVNLGGSLRWSQILMMFVVLAGFARILQDGRVLWPRGATALALWAFSQILFSPFVGVLGIAFNFLGLLLLTVAGVYAIVQLYAEAGEKELESLLRIYLLSFVAVSAVGLLQFALPLIGLPSFLIQQWIVTDRMARITAFSYEPSYFASYMIIGWVTLWDLRHSKARIVDGKFWKWAFYIVTAALFFSTSKAAWGFLVLETVLRTFRGFLTAVQNTLDGFRAGRILYRLPSIYLVAAILVVSITLGVLVSHVLTIVDPRYFIAGTGLNNTADHSFGTRNGDAISTWEAFLDHPILGRSMGGVPVYRAQRAGFSISTMAEVRQFWGFPVLLDVLAASGIIAFIPFLFFLYNITVGPMLLVRKLVPTEHGKWVQALARAMIYEWIVLFVDQNLFRVYLWLHISMMMLMAYRLEFIDSPGVLSRTLPSPILGPEEAVSST